MLGCEFTSNIDANSQRSIAVPNGGWQSDE